jgi:hypothetical protein
VTIYRSKEGEIQDDERSVYTYNYESWNPQVCAFITMSQTFHKFSSTEFRWNKLDNVVVGNIPADTYEEAMKMKRLKYAILPPEIYSEEEAAEYFAKIDLLVDFLNKYTAGSDDVVAISKDRMGLLERMDSEGADSRKYSFEKGRSGSNASTGSVSAPGGNSFIYLYSQSLHAIGLYRRTDAHHCDTAKLVMRTAKQGNPAWLYCRYDKTAYTYKALHLEFHWVVCDSWLIDDMLTVLYRRCQKWGLRLCQVPQYYSKDDLNVHPFRGLPYLPVTKSQRDVPAAYPSPLRMVEKFLFSRRNGWLFDNEYRTDWALLAMGVPSYLDRDRDLLALDAAPLTVSLADTPDTTGAQTPPTPSMTGDTAPLAPEKDKGTTTPKHTTFSSLTQSLSRMVMGRPDDNSAGTQSGAAGASALTKAIGLRKPASSRRVDRQYMYHNGLAVVRVAAQGFLWMQNTSSKVSDVNLSIDERRDLVAKNLAMVTQACEKVPLCFDLCIEIVELALDHAQHAQTARELLDGCLDDCIAPVVADVVQSAIEEVTTEAAAPPAIEEEELAPAEAVEVPEQIAHDTAAPETTAGVVGIAMVEPFPSIGETTGADSAADTLTSFMVDAPASRSDDAALHASSDGPTGSDGDSTVMVREGRAWTAGSFISSASGTPHTLYPDSFLNPDGSYLGISPRDSSAGISPRDPFPLIHVEIDQDIGAPGLSGVSSAASLTLSSVSSAVVSPMPPAEARDTFPEDVATSGVAQLSDKSN